MPVEQERVRGGWVQRHVITRRLRRRARLEAMALGVVVLMVQVPTAAPTQPGRWDRAPLTAAGAADVIRRSTVQVLAFGCDLRRHEGTAVAIAPDRILTNTHVIAGSRLVDVVADGQPAAVATSSTQAVTGDVAWMVAAGLDLPGIPLAPEDAARGSDVRLAGYPSAPAGHREEGLVVDDDRVIDYLPGAELGEPGRVMRLSGPSRPGMSGGPVLDDAGHLAGIVFGVEVDTGHALVIPASVLRGVLRRGGAVASPC